jgi:hypothetical protein
MALEEAHLLWMPAGTPWRGSDAPDALELGCILSLGTGVKEDRVLKAKDYRIEGQRSNSGVMEHLEFMQRYPHWREGYRRINVGGRLGAEVELNEWWKLDYLIDKTIAWTCRKDVRADIKFVAQLIVDQLNCRRE